MTNSEFELAFACADALADWSLRGVKDKHGQPLIRHARRVAIACEDLSQEQRLAAVLHDCMEDGGLDGNCLDTIFGERVAVLVIALTRNLDESYRDYIAWVSRCPDAVPIKLADLGDNLSTWRGPISDSLRRRYLEARTSLRREHPQWAAMGCTSEEGGPRA